MNNHSKLFLAMLPLLGTASLVHADDTLAPVVVTATKTDYRDTDAPYASEVYTADQIAASGATSLYDFLAQQSSVTVMPSYGNTFSQQIDMRGFGIGNGYQNIVVIVDGRRLNNIDMSPPLLSAIALASIERIEITKGSGSVMEGDGATAGTIRIYTRDRDGAHLTVAAGNFGTTISSLTAGLSADKLAVSVTAENSARDGYSDKGTDGQRDSASSNNLHAMAHLYATDTTELHIGKDRSRIDTRYPGSLTLAEFSDNPAQNGGNAYTHQTYDSDGTAFGLTTRFAVHTLTFDHYQEQRHVEYVGWSLLSDYDNRSDDLALTTTLGKFNLVTGLQGFKGIRTSSSNQTSKKNSALYLQGDYRFTSTTLSLGGRRERVRYEYVPTSGTRLEDESKLSAGDIGINHQFTQGLSLFANYNYSYQAPDIDRFFNAIYDPVTYQVIGVVFNDFIAPARVRTFNIGINHVTGNNKLKVTLFRSNLRNEIYFDPFTYTNTNLDRTHKYGLELQEKHRFNEQWSGNANYTWTRALIDSEDQGGGAYNGKELPGVSRHTATLGITYQPTTQMSIAVNHNFRSSAYAANDFTNSAAQRQGVYNSTNLRYGYRLKNGELFVKVDNLFKRANGLWIRDDAIYPVNFTRNWLFGLKTDF